MRAADRTLQMVPALPDTAVRGDTPDARRAGERTARRTVTRPIRIPAARPGRLTANTGIPEK